jgi:hypothetical protein
MIRVTQREHLLHCVVPAVDVRAGEAPGIGERAVPAEVAALEAALTKAGETWRYWADARISCHINYYAGKHEGLKLALEIIRGRAATGGNGEAQQQGGGQTP